MRPVKRALKMLENPEENMTEKEQVAQTRQVKYNVPERNNHRIAQLAFKKSRTTSSKETCRLYLMEFERLLPFIFSFSFFN